MALKERAEERKESRRGKLMCLNQVVEDNTMDKITYATAWCSGVLSSM